MQENQAVSALRQAGYQVENGPEINAQNGGQNGAETGIRIGAKTVKQADQVTAYKRVRTLLTTHCGMDAEKAALILTAAYTPEMDGHEEAKAFVERVSRDHGCGLYPDRPLLPNARQGVRA